MVDAASVLVEYKKSKIHDFSNIYFEVVLPPLTCPWAKQGLPDYMMY